METYEEFSVNLFNRLLDQHKKDPSFTFSVRQKPSKGAESNYFIGTEKSRYMGTTLWYVPVGYPGNASDLINLMFRFTDTGYKYKIQFNQTKKPYNQQNKHALKLIQNLKPIIKKEFPAFSENAPTNKMEYFEISAPKREYRVSEDLFNDVGQDLQG